MTKLSFLSLVVVTGVGCAVACSSSGDDTAATGGSGGSGATAGHIGSTTGGTSSSTGGTAPGTSTGGTSSSTGGSGGATSTLYDRLGKNAGISAAIGAIVTAELGDADIATYFAPNLTPKHMPQPGDIEECFTSLLGHAAGGPEVYPMTTKGGFTCRDMATAHADLGINSGTFDKFVMIAAGVLTTANVAQADIATIGTVLNGTKSAIATDPGTTEAPCSMPACDVPGAAGAGAGGAGGAQ